MLMREGRHPTALPLSVSPERISGMVATFTPKDWADKPTKTTAIMAADLERYENTLAAHAAAINSIPAGSQGIQGPKGDDGEPGPVGPQGVVLLAVGEELPDPVVDGVLYLRVVSTVDVTAPTVPTGLASSAITSSGFTVTWSAATDAVGVTGYQVRIGSGTPVDKTTLSHSFTGLTAATAYSVTVRARDAAGNFSAWSTALPVTTSAGVSALFSDTFDRANGAVGNGWVFPSGGSGAVASNTLAMTGWSGYDRAYQAGLPRVVSARAVFAGTIGAYQGIFIAESSTIGGIKLFNNGGTWVLGNSNNFGADNTAVAFSNTPSTPYTTLRLDFDGTTVTAYINGIVVHSATLVALGMTLDTTGGNVYRAGYCGEPKAPNLDSFEVYAA